MNVFSPKYFGGFVDSTQKEVFGVGEKKMKIIGELG